MILDSPQRDRVIALHQCHNHHAHDHALNQAQNRTIDLSVFDSQDTGIIYPTGNFWASFTVSVIHNGHAGPVERSEED
ncbi:hypothetical protein [Kamptonema sp. PCC 6506]|uniref:hypothetical protein n=1 Tax=Kamptonema sp. PCC 6506 TaxID=272129 RepID=UPI0011D1E621|nr:hypothetical protein [Kamptonema sp. PCC 6506]